MKNEREELICKKERKKEMKFFTQKTILQKICISIVLVVVLGTSVAIPKAYAFGWTDLPGKLLKEFTQLIVLLAD